MVLDGIKCNIKWFQWVLDGIGWYWMVSHGVECLQSSNKGVNNHLINGINQLINRIIRLINIFFG